MTLFVNSFVLSVPVVILEFGVHICFSCSVIVGHLRFLFVASTELQLIDSSLTVISSILYIVLSPTILNLVCAHLECEHLRFRWPSWNYANFGYHVI